MKSINKETLNSFAEDLDQVRDQVRAKLGHEDAKYIRKIIAIQRISEITARILMVMGFISPLLWVVAVLLLAFAKILDNMEIGHNVMHGQYDWMNDPNINSKDFEWDILGDAGS